MEAKRRATKPATHLFCSTAGPQESSLAAPGGYSGPKLAPRRRRRRPSAGWARGVLDSEGHGGRRREAATRRTEDWTCVTRTAVSESRARARECAFERRRSRSPPPLRMAAKGTSLKEAIKQFEVAKGCNAAEAEKARSGSSLLQPLRLSRSRPPHHRWSSGDETRRLRSWTGRWPR